MMSKVFLRKPAHLVHQEGKSTAFPRSACSAIEKIVNGIRLNITTKEHTIGELFEGKIYRARKILNNIKPLSILILGTSTTALCNTTLDIYCFTSGEKIPIQFEMRDYTDKYLFLNYAFIKYRNSRTWIPLVPTSITSSSTNQESRDEIVSSWLEITNNTPSGSYEMTTEGVTVKAMRYTNYSRKKVFSFIHDTGVEFSAEQGCKWKSR